MIDKKAHNSSNYTHQLISLIKKIHSPNSESTGRLSFAGSVSTRNSKAKAGAHTRALTSEIGKLKEKSAANTNRRPKSTKRAKRKGGASVGAA